MKSLSESAKICETRKKTANVFGWIFSILAILCVIGAIVSIVMLGLNEKRQFLFSMLALGAIAVTLVCGVGAFFCFRAGMRQEKLQLDFLERKDSEESFFVGEDTLATFTDTSLKLHASAGKKGKVVCVPYGEIRFFSVCIRHAAREAGEWCVVLEIPAKYLQKGKAKAGEPPVLIQADGKQRLYDCLAKHGLKLLGEARREVPDRRFRCETKFVLPDYAERRKKLMLAAVGVALVAAGVAVCFIWRDWVVLGATLSALGLYLAIHAGFGAYRARTTLALYDEGIYWKQKTRIESTFLKWEEIQTVSLKRGEENVLRLGCDYGEYGFPAPDGAFECVAEKFPNKLKS